MCRRTECLFGRMDERLMHRDDGDGDDDEYVEDPPLSPSSSSSPPAHGGGGVVESSIPLVPDRRKGLLAAVLFFLLFVATISVAQVLETGGLPLTDLDDVSVQRLAVARVWGNGTADPCGDFYEYACGNFERMTVNGSVLGMTSINVVGKHQAAELDDGVDAAADWSVSWGIFPHYAVEVRYQRVFLFTLNDTVVDDDDTVGGTDGGRPRGWRRRTLEQFQWAPVYHAIPVTPGMSSMISATTMHFNAWISDPSVTVFLVGDTATPVAADFAWWGGTDGDDGPALNVSVASVQMQVDALDMAPLFYTPADTNVLSNAASTAIVEGARAFLLPFNSRAL